MTSEYREPPDLSGKKLDFSQAHFLDHRIWECHKYQYAAGGWRTHLSHRWQFQWRNRVMALTRCKVGWHRPTQFWQGRPPNALTWSGCIHCWKQLSEKQPT